MRKTERQQVILDLVKSQKVANQDELVRLLTSRGFSVTQASISRDLEELEIVKIDGHYGFRPPGSLQPEFGRVSVTLAGDNLIIVKCSSGLASAAAVRIDSARISEIAGTIAGDDTIFVAVIDENDQISAVRKIKGVLGVE